MNFPPNECLHMDEFMWPPPRSRHKLLQQLRRLPNAAFQALTPLPTKETTMATSRLVRSVPEVCTRHHRTGLLCLASLPPHTAVPERPSCA